jgi:hypothetical protein
MGLDCHATHYASSSITGLLVKEIRRSRTRQTRSCCEGLAWPAIILHCHEEQTFAPEMYRANARTRMRQAVALTAEIAISEDWKGHTPDGLVAHLASYKTIKPMRVTSAIPVCWRHPCHEPPRFVGTRVKVKSLCGEWRMGDHREEHSQARLYGSQLSRSLIY